MIWIIQTTDESDDEKGNKKTTKWTNLIFLGVVRFFVVPFLFFMIVGGFLIGIFHNTTEYKESYQKCMENCKKNGYSENDCLNNQCDFPI